MTKGTLRVLLVHNEGIKLKAVRSVFSKRRDEFELKTVHRPKKACDLLSDWVPHLVLITWERAKETGFLEAETKIPFLIVHGNWDEELAFQALEMGALDFYVLTEETATRLPWIVRKAHRDWKAVMASWDGSPPVPSSLQTVLDALPFNAVLLDDRGGMVAVNRTWRVFAAKEGLRDILGASYAEVCRFASESEETRRLSLSIRDGVAGKKNPNFMEYIKQEGTQARWFRINLDRCGNESPSRLLLIHEDISELKRSEEKLRGDDFHYRAVMEDQNVMISRFKPDGTLTFVNEAYAQYWGKTPNELIGINFLQLFPEPTRKQARIFLEGFSPGNHKKTVEHQVIRNDGVASRYTWTDRAFFDAQGQLTEFHSIGRDVSKRWRAETRHKRAEKELRETEELFGQLTEHINEVFWLYNWEDQGIYYVSPAFENIWGLPAETQYSESSVWPDAVCLEDQDRVARAFNTKAASGDYDETYRITRPDGSSRWIRDRGFPISDDTGKVYRIAGIAEDITESKEAEEERIHLESQLRQVQKMEAIGQLTGGIAHDFNNILACILGYTDMAIEIYGQDPDSKLARYLREVYQAGDRARELVAQMLVFSRGGKSDPKPLHLRELIRQTLKMLKSMLPATIELKVVAQDSLPAVLLDPVQFHQLLMNLSMNAFAAMGVHGVLTVGVSTVKYKNESCVSCQARVKGKFVELLVRDTGHGIQESFIEKIFEPFFTTKEVGKGTGMGLSVVHGIVHEHRGHILLNTEIGNGTEFKILFRSVQETVARQSRKDAELEKSHDRGKGGWVLIVDDEYAICNLLKDIFSNWGYQVMVFTESPKALERFKDTPDVFKLVVTDQTMPKITGMELSREFHKLRPELPIILITGYSELVNEEALNKLNIKGFLAKPLDFHKLSKLVKDLVD